MNSFYPLLYQEHAMAVYQSLDDLAMDRAVFNNSNLTEAIFQEVIFESYRSMNEAIEYDPPGHASYLARAGAIRSIRAQLVDYGWLPEDERGLSWIYSPDRGIRIYVSAGVNIGDPNVAPKTRYERGPVFERAVTCNAQQLHLPFIPVDGPVFMRAVNCNAQQLHLPFIPVEVEVIPVESEVEAGVQQEPETWVLFFEHDLENEQSRFELSRPIALDHYVDRWLFDPLDHNIIFNDQSDPYDGSDAVDAGDIDLGGFA